MSSLCTGWGFSAARELPLVTVSTAIGPFADQSVLNRAVLHTLEKQITQSPSAHLYWVRGRNRKGQTQPLLFYRRQPVTGLQAPCGIVWLTGDLRQWTRNRLQWVSWATDADIHALSRKSVPIQVLYDLHQK